MNFQKSESAKKFGKIWTKMCELYKIFKNLAKKKCSFLLWISKSWLANKWAKTFNKILAKNVLIIWILKN